MLKRSGLGQAGCGRLEGVGLHFVLLTGATLAVCTEGKMKNINRLFSEVFL